MFFDAGLFMCEHPTTIVEARDLLLAAVVPPVPALSSLRYADLWTLSALVKFVAASVRGLLVLSPVRWWY